MKKDKKGSSYIGYALICVILGGILIGVGYFINNDMSKNNKELVDVVAKVASYEDVGDNKVNVICKYGYDGNEYNYVCHKGKKDEIMKLFKIGAEEKIKVNQSTPGRITILDLRFVIFALYTIGLVFLLIAMLYMISEIVRLVKRNKYYNENVI